MVAFELLERGIPRRDYPLIIQEKEVGKVTSGGISPVLNKGIGMGYVPLEQAEVGNSLEIAVRNKRLKAQIIKNLHLFGNTTYIK